MSAILSTDDLNDFISPGVACIKPIETLPKKQSQNDESAYEVTTEDKAQPENLPPAQISLTDCLACSGCVTSAEAVLISLQSHQEVLNTLDSCREFRVTDCRSTVAGDCGHKSRGSRKSYPDDELHNTSGNTKLFVASVSPQVRASLAATYGISEREAGYLIEQFLSGPHGLRAGGRYGNGFAWVVDTNVMRQVCQELSTAEVIESIEASESSIANLGSSPVPRRPVLSSACPGWICYVEKTHPHILPYMSRLKSPQALSGTFLKSLVSRALHIPPSEIWHLAVMPCFDKKLEASREELTDASWQILREENSLAGLPEQAVRDVDCVITSRELLLLASSRNISLSTLPLQPLPPSFFPPFPDATVSSFLFPRSRPSRQPPAAGTSGGYLYHLLATCQWRNPGSKIQAQRGRNADVIEYSLVSASGALILKAARYYGFRNIQNLVRKLKPARTLKLSGINSNVSSAASRRTPHSTTLGAVAEFAYIEVMACPGGCTNGGGQIRVEDAKEINSSVFTDIDPRLPSPQPQPQPLAQPHPQKLSPQEQRNWLARVDEAYYSADSESEVDSSCNLFQLPLSNSHPRYPETNDKIVESIISYWSRATDVPISKLAYTTFRKVESNVGKNRSKGNSGAAGDTSRVIELAGKVDGGW